MEPDDRRVLSARRQCSGRARRARTGRCDAVRAGPDQKRKSQRRCPGRELLLEPTPASVGTRPPWLALVVRQWLRDQVRGARTGICPSERPCTQGANSRRNCATLARESSDRSKASRGVGRSRVPRCRRANFCALKGNADLKDPCEVLPRSSESFRKPVRRASELPLRWEGCHEGFRRNRPRRRCRDASLSGKKEEYARGGDGMRHAGSSDLPAHRIVISTRRTRVACSPRARPSRARDFHTVRSSFPQLVASSASWKCTPLVHSVRARAWERSRQALEQRSTRAVPARDLDPPRDPIALHDPATGLRCVFPPTRRKGFGT